jgi:dihydrodipicolinate synthase/N-acetylneuraminate lyase
MNNQLCKEKVIVPMVSPFNPDYSIDERAVARMSELFLEAGVSVFVLGTTGEGDSMSATQRETLLKLVVKEINGRLKLYAGLTGNSLHASIEDARKYAGLGANYLVAKLPSYYPMNDNQMLRYLELLADSSPLPLFIYNIPTTTHHSIPLAVIEKLSHHPMIAGIKDSERDISRLDESIRRWGDRDDFDFLIGWAAMSVYGLTKGANGIVPGTGNLVPGWYVQLLVEVMNGNTIEAMQFQQKTDQISALYQKGLSLSQSITALKVMMKIQGLCSCEVLPPLQRTPLAEEEHFISYVKEEWKKICL